MPRQINKFVLLLFASLIYNSSPPAVAQNNRIRSLSPLQTQVMGSQTWIANARSGVRVIISNHMTGKPVQAAVRISIAPVNNDGTYGKPISLLSRLTDSLGTIDTGFRAPAAKAGSYEMRVDVQSPLGADHIKQSIELKDFRKILLTTDKPAYQPGQTIRVRALAIDQATQRPVHDEPISIEIKDGRDNKVYKSQPALSKYGIASADFVLAEEVNEGAFTVSVDMPSGHTDKSVRVEHYILPKYKVSIETDRPYYLPGDTIHGTVGAQYFFGKPVTNAQSEIEIAAPDAAVTTVVKLSGLTGDDGKWKFEYKVPDQFGGDRFVDCKAALSIHAGVTDLTLHTEQAENSTPIVAQPVLLNLIPEHRLVVTGVPNRVFIAAAKPDGSPVSNAEITAQVINRADGSVKATTTVNTDALGIGAFEFEPDAEEYDIIARYTDDRGVLESAKITVGNPGARDGLILQTDTVFARVGDPIRLTAVTEGENDTVYFDVIRGGQTLIARAINAQFGTAATSIPITNDMAGTLEAHAYIVAANGQIVEDTRTIIVSPAQDLKVALTTDRMDYKPGDDALVHVSVTNAANKPGMAALGLGIVDESVFSLAEQHPGYERAFFTLATELLDPQFQINNISVADIYNKTDMPAPDRQRAGAMLMSAVGQKSEFDYHVNTFDIRWAQSKAGFQDDMKLHYMTIAAALREYSRGKDANINDPDLMTKLLREHLIWREDFSDPWGTPYKLTGSQDHPSIQRFDYSSAGPDQIWNTPDDLGVGAPPYYNPSIGGNGGGFGGGGFGGGGIGGGGFEDEASTSVPSNPTPQPDDTSPAKTPVDITPMRPSLSAQTDEEPVTSAQPQPRVREFFPETLFWNPQIITDDRGSADIRLPLADSITTWRLSAMANDGAGLLGSATSSIKVFQDFFVDVDLPISLTQGDEFTVPVTVHNYMSEGQDVTVTLTADSWFKSSSDLTQRIHIAAGEVSLVKFPITASEFGSHTFTVTAIGTKMSDAVKRPIQILPNGQENSLSIGDELEGKVSKTMNIPDAAIDKASHLWVKIFPGVVSELLDGLDGLLRMPGGCFEQTSASTYPDVLILQYLDGVHKASPDIRAKANAYISSGYQRLLTFEGTHGGFSWWGGGDEHQVLTAFGLLEFHDMAAVYPVDNQVIQRTQRWLAQSQLNDGSWLETREGHDWGIINRQTDKLRTTAYVGWSLAESGYDGPEIDRATAYIKQHAAEANDSYSAALLLAYLTAPGIQGGDLTDSVALKLQAKARTTNSTAFWDDGTDTFTGAEGAGADAETTGLACYALLKYRRAPGLAAKAVTYLSQTRSSYGGWSTTQSTVWSLKALQIAAPLRKSTGSGSVDVAVNGQIAKTIRFDESNGDVLQQIDVTPSAHSGHNTVTLQYHGEGGVIYQIAGQYYMPWSSVVGAMSSESMSLKVVYDKTVLTPADTTTATMTARNITSNPVRMPLLDIGTPPGFDIDRDTLETAVKSGDISKYTLGDGHLVVYLETLKANGAISLKYRMHPRSAMKVLTPASRAYPYYNPGSISTFGPQLLEVQETK